jgi:hypothetical protein
MPRCLADMSEELNQTAPARDSGFIEEPELRQRIPVSRRTLYDWRHKGVLPFVQIDRKIIYHWPTVEAALLRKQRGMRHDA